MLDAARYSYSVDSFHDDASSARSSSGSSTDEDEKQRRAVKEARPAESAQSSGIGRQSESGQSSGIGLGRQYGAGKEGKGEDDEAKAKLHAALATYPWRSFTVSKQFGWCFTVFLKGNAFLRAKSINPYIACKGTGTSCAAPSGPASSSTRTSRPRRQRAARLSARWPERSG